MRPTTPLNPGSTSLRQAGYKSQVKPFQIIPIFLPSQLFFFYPTCNCICLHPPISCHLPTSPWRPRPSRPSHAPVWPSPATSPPRSQTSNTLLHTPGGMKPPQPSPSLVGIPCPQSGPPPSFLTVFHSRLCPWSPLPGGFRLNSRVGPANWEMRTGPFKVSSVPAGPPR